MKKNPGRKERHRTAKINRNEVGRKRAKHNEWLQHMQYILAWRAYKKTNEKASKTGLRKLLSSLLTRRAASC